LINRINEQIRFFYFYYFLSVAFRIGIFLLGAAILMKFLTAYTVLASRAPIASVWVKTQCMLGLPPIESLVVFASYTLIFGWSLSGIFARTAEGIIVSEMDARHVFLVSHKSEIQEIAKRSMSDPFLASMLLRRIDKEKGVSKEACAKPSGIRSKPAE